MHKQHIQQRDTPQKRGPVWDTRYLFPDVDREAIKRAVLHGYEVYHAAERKELSEFLSAHTWPASGVEIAPC